MRKPIFESEEEANFFIGHLDTISFDDIDEVVADIKEKGYIRKSAVEEVENESIY